MASVCVNPGFRQRLAGRWGSNLAFPKLRGRVGGALIACDMDDGDQSVEEESSAKLRTTSGTLEEPEQSVDDASAAALAESAQESGLCMDCVAGKKKRKNPRNPVT
eukprot:6028883-Amphidinium_carterae.1